MSIDPMQYKLLTEEAMRGVIRLALQRAASKEGLPGDHHFYITFLTGHEGVVLPDHLKQDYPDEMTIVIKRKYWDLEVGQEGFSVGLSFRGMPETIQVSYAAVVRFLDPEAQFLLHFGRPANLPAPKEPPPPEPEQQQGEAEIVSLDAFRKR